MSWTSTFMYSMNDYTERKREKNPEVNILDIQFSPVNFPGTVYYDVFNKANVWQGGYNLDQHTIK